MSILQKLVSWAGKADVARATVARQARVKIGPLHRVSFRLGTKSIRVANLSCEGMALFKVDAAEISTGITLHGELTIGEQAFALTTDARHFSGELIGCRFSRSENLTRAIDDYFRLEILGLRLRPINREYLKSDPRGSPMWFTDGGSNEFYYVTNAGAFVAFHFTFLGHYVEGAANSSPRTGRASRSADEPAQTTKASDLVHLDDVAAPAVLQLALQVLRNIEGLPSADRKAVERSLFVTQSK